MGAKILVVEDEDALSALLEYNLQREGFSPRIVPDGDDAMLAIEEDQPDLVLLDWMLPGLSGIEICRRIRARTELSALLLCEGLPDRHGCVSVRRRHLHTGQERRLTSVALRSERHPRSRLALAGRRDCRVEPGDQLGGPRRGEPQQLSQVLQTSGPGGRGGDDG